MANPAIARFSILLLVLFSTLVNITFSAESPAPVPDSSAESPDSAPHSSAGSPSHAAPTPNPSPASSPEAPIPAPPHPDSPPAPTPVRSPSPSPSPAGKDDNGTNHTDVGDLNGESSGGGMSSGKKAGIAVGVFAAIGVVALGALVYKKRRENVQRSQYGYAARRELL